jgi:hypothetical protein
MTKIKSVRARVFNWQELPGLGLELDESNLSNFEIAA